MSNTSINLSKLADFIGAKLIGEAAVDVHSIAPLNLAKAGDVSFLDNPKYKKFLSSTEASAVIVREADAKDCQVAALVMENPYLGFAKAANYFQTIPQQPIGVHPSAIIHDDCDIHPSASIGPRVVIGQGVKIAEGVSIAAGCVIGDHVSIGPSTRLWANVVIYYSCQLGARCILHAGVVIGSDGFGMAKDNGLWHKVPQLGRVMIGDDVEIGANTTIDRGALGDTIIEEGVKLDNQIQIGHNVKIGAHTAIAACCGISGSTTIGKHCMVGGMTPINGHISICDNVAITGFTMVTKSITEPGVYSSGIPMMPNKEWLRNALRFRQLSETVTRAKRVEKAVEEIANRLDEEAK